MSPERFMDLQHALSYVDGFIRSAVARVQSLDMNPSEMLRGLVITEQEVQQQLARSPFQGIWDETCPRPDLFDPSSSKDSPFIWLAEQYNLTLFDINILLFALAPQFDRRYERLYGYLQDDVSQKSPTLSLMMNLLSEDAESRLAVWERLSPTMPLRHHHLIKTTDQTVTSLLSTAFTVDARVMNFILGDLSIDERLTHAIEVVEILDIPLEFAQMPTLSEAMSSAPMVYMEGVDTESASQIAVRLCADYSLPLLQINAQVLFDKVEDAKSSWALALREGYLHGAGLIITHWKACLDDAGIPKPTIWKTLSDYPYPIFMSGRDAWVSQDTNRARRLLNVKIETPPFAIRRDLWMNALTDYGMKIAKGEIDRLANKFRFTPTQVQRAVTTAVDFATGEGRKLELNDLYEGAKAHSSLQLGHLAKQVTPRHTWDDLILPPDPTAQLQELKSRVEQAQVVREQWGFGDKVAPTRGVKGLFAGESGTGKTMAATVLAYDLGMLMYRIDLSMVVSKYIGETEKNLRKIFEEAHASNAILFFDEADALFGKRSEVKDAHDRYANVETAYLLQQFEDFDGIAILATNLRQNLDDAFTRRLDFVIDFPFPEPEFRERIWRKHFPAEAPIANDIDFVDLAERYRFAGGNIRNAAVASAYFAAANGGQITTQHIRQAIRREHQKMGRLAEDF